MAWPERPDVPYGTLVKYDLSVIAVLDYFRLDGHRPIPPCSSSMPVIVRSACVDRHVSISCDNARTIAGSVISVLHVGSPARS